MLVLGLNVLDFRWKCLNTGNSDICLFLRGEEGGESSFFISFNFAKESSVEAILGLVDRK